MNTKLSDLLASLPEENGSPDILDSEEAQERLKAIFADLAYRPVPTHSLHRLWTLGELSVQITLAYTALWFRQLFASAPTKDRRAMETNLRVALKMIHRLGYLRGAATKLGQALGGLPEVLPHQIVSTLDMLHFQAPPMHFSLLREAVRNEFGKDPEELFASFDREPFAAASIGQVHRATLKSGETVAVKIQYPGIARAVEADVRNFMALMFPMRLTRQWESAKGQCKAIQEMLDQEVDYVREARNMREAAALFEPGEGIVIPRVFEEYSTARVLTTEFVPGLQLNEFLASNPPQSLRNAFGGKIALIWYRTCFAFLNYGDPHSGNYVFMNDGRLGLLDFGCVQRFTAEERKIFPLTDAFVDDPTVLPEVLRAGGFATDADLANEDFTKLFGEYWSWFFEPERYDGAFDFGDEAYFKRGIELAGDLVLKTYAAAAPMYVYLSRSFFGHRALLLRLRAQLDVRNLHRREVEIRLARENRS
jgi:aarF domain-containing kinase